MFSRFDGQTSCSSIVRTMHTHCELKLQPVPLFWDDPNLLRACNALLWPQQPKNSSIPKLFLTHITSVTDSEQTYVQQNKPRLSRNASIVR